MDAIQLSIPKGRLAGAPTGTTYASMADYRLSLSWPSWLRMAQEGALQVFLEEIEEVNASSQTEQPAQVILVEPLLTGIEVDPPGRMQTSLASSQSLEMSWTLIGQARGVYPGKVLVSLAFFDESSNELVAVPVAVVDIAVRVANLWGVEPKLALWFGGVGLALWGALFVLGRWVQARR
jgi:hypothetical protein